MWDGEINADLGPPAATMLRRLGEKRLNSGLGLQNGEKWPIIRSSQILGPAKFGTKCCP